jgi:hypothetical protein
MLDFLYHDVKKKKRAILSRMALGPTQVPIQQISLPEGKGTQNVQLITLLHWNIEFQYNSNEKLV